MDNQASRLMKEEQKKEIRSRIKAMLHEDDEYEAEKMVRVDGYDMQAYQAVLEALRALRNSKPKERGEAARYYAIAITEIEKAAALFKVHVIGEL